VTKNKNVQIEETETN